MKDLYTQTAFDCSKLITKTYSTSFSLGIRTLSEDYRESVYAIYGFVRYADEIVDTFHNHDKKALLQRFKEDTYRSIKEKISLNPVLHSFQKVINEYQIDYDLIEAFLISMEMDLNKTDYATLEYEKYIYGSAEVVGLMCLKVFCHGHEKEYQELLTSAKCLGSAFQKVNFLRDIKSDYHERGRVYFPDLDFNHFSKEKKKQIEESISHEFKKALEGIKRLPKGARSGVYLAYIYYTVLFKKIIRLSPERIKHERIRVPNFRKFLLLLKCYLFYKINYLIK